MSMVAEVLLMRGCLLECEECGDEGVSRSYTYAVFRSWPFALPVECLVPNSKAFYLNTQFLILMDCARVVYTIALNTLYLDLGLAPGM